MHIATLVLENHSLCVCCWWRQVVKQDGGRGLVPLSYLHIAEEDEDEGDVFSLAGRTDVSGAQSQAESATDFNSFLKGCVTLLLLRLLLLLLLLEPLGWAHAACGSCCAGGCHARLLYAVCPQHLGM
jgi:hypothetical protein